MDTIRLGAAGPKEGTRTPMIAEGAASAPA